MTYEFDVAEDQCGTFWYHAHSQLQRADGLYGGLVVHCPDEQDNPGKRPARQHESERLLLMGDWYHRPAAETLAWYHHWRSFGNEVSLARLQSTLVFHSSVLIERSQSPTPSS